MPDYGQQLRSALDAARQALITQRNSALTQRQAGATTLGHAEAKLAVADEKFQRCQDAVKDAEEVFKLAAQGTAIIKNANELAQKATVAAEAATDAIAVAASDIKSLADTFDTLASQISGIHAIAHIDDRRGVTDVASQLTRTLVAKADQSTEQLKMLSLGLSIQAAKSSAEAATSGIATLGTDMQALMDAATSYLGETTAKLTEQRKYNATALAAEKVAVQAYGVARLANDAGVAALSDVNEIVNWSLSAADVYDARKGPSLQVSFRSLDIGLGASEQQSLLAYFNGTDGYYLFAVPQESVPSFTFAAALQLIESSAADSRSQPEAEKSSSAKNAALQKFIRVDPPTVTTLQAIGSAPSPAYALPFDISGQPLQVGATYVAFALRAPYQGVSAADESDLSLPSEPVMFGYKLPQPLKAVPQITPVTAAPPSARPPLFQVTFDAQAQLDSYFSQYRAIVLRQDVFNALETADLLFLAEQLGPVSYRPMVPKSSGQPTQTVTFQDGDTDAYGDVIDEGIHYICLVLLVGGSNKVPVLSQTQTKVSQEESTEEGKKSVAATASQKTSWPSERSTPNNTPNVLSSPSLPFKLPLASSTVSSKARS
jgi:hypothetical protein